MRYTVVVLLLTPVLLLANPVPDTYINEFSTDTAHPWLELHHSPDFSGPVDITGWTLSTTASCCTLGGVLDEDEYLVIDSAAIAQGIVGTGTFRLNPAVDTIRLYGVAGQNDYVEYPYLPASQGWAPAPPPGASAALFFNQDYSGTFTNWYIDSSPTPADTNNDFSAVTGRVRGDRGQLFEYGDVCAYGPTGSSGAGRYRLCVFAWFHGEYYTYILPESVDVGYSANVPDVDLIVPMSAVAEEQPVPAPVVTIRQEGQELAVTGDGELTIFDLSGRSVLSASGSGTWRFDTAVLRPGVYFARLKEVDHSAVKVVIPR
jgi:hypothetical protein